MIIFDQLRISDNGKMLYVDIHVNKADLFDNIFIDRGKWMWSVEGELRFPPGGTV